MLNGDTISAWVKKQKGRVEGTFPLSHKEDGGGKTGQTRKGKEEQESAEGVKVTCHTWSCGS